MSDAKAVPLLEVSGLAKTYHDGTRELQVLRKIDMLLKQGESLAIVGASGSGKSTLLHLLGGLDRPTAGEILMQGRSLTTMSPPVLARHRLINSGFVFQAHHLLSEFTALENVVLPLLAARRSRAQARRTAEELLTRVGLGERLTHRPSQLSGGEQQRVAIARALANSPTILLADEPTGNLDEATGTQVMDVLFEASEGRGLIIVTHDPAIAERAHRIVRLHDGVLEKYTGPEAVASEPVPSR